MRGVNDRLHHLARVFYAPPFVILHNRLKKALPGRNERAVARPPLQPISEKERGDILQALIQPGLIAAGR